MLTEKEIEYLKEVSKSGNTKDWDEACSKIKANHGGKYPGNWYEVVILGGLAPNIEISITFLDNN